jgi:DNA-binding SARP family transcriptional activator
MPSLHLLETPYLDWDDTRIELPAQKPICFLVYLAYQGTWVSREVLASLFWPESDDDTARHNLRMMLSRAKQFPWAKDVEAEPSRLRWQITTDVQVFREAVGHGQWEKAARVHQSPLLASWRLPDMIGVEEWLELEREALLSSWREAVLKHSRNLIKQKQHDQAAELLRELLKYDALAEDVLALYLEQAYLAGQRDEALRIYTQFEKNLADELDLEPMDSTRALVETIRRAEVVKPIETPLESQVPLVISRPPRLMGREKEQRQLEKTKASVVIVSGEPGVGKSRFLEESLPAARWLRCREGLENVPYLPLSDYVRANRSALTNVGPYLYDLARLVPDVLANASTSTPDPQTAKTRLAEALALVLEANSSPLVFEDIQWADEGTLEILIFLASRQKLKLYASYRSNETTPRLLSTLQSLHSSRTSEDIKLGALSAHDIQALLANLIGIKKGPERFSQWLSERSGGNPFFALETLKSLFENGILNVKNGQWHSQLDDITQDYTELEVPLSISELIERRLSRLSDSTRRVVQAASVMREGFTPKLLSQIVGLSEWGVLEALEEAEANSIVQTTRFAHDLLRQSIYKSLAQTRRKLLHGQVAEVLQDQAEPMILAEHYAEAGEIEKSVDYRLKAVEKYVSRGLHSSAQTILQKALNLDLEPSVVHRLKAKLADVDVEVGFHSEAERLLQELLETSVDLRVRADALFAQGSLLLHQGKLIQVAEVAEKVSVLPIVWQDTDRYKLNFLKAQVAFYQNKPAEVKTLLEPMVSELRRKPVSSELVKALTDMGSALEGLGEHKEAMALYQEANQFAKAIGALHLQVILALNMLGSAVLTKQTEMVLPIAEEALGLGDYAVTMSLRNNLGAAYASLGRNDEAIIHYQTITEKSHDPTLLCIAWGRLASLYKQPKQISDALKQGLKFMNQTEFGAARLRLAIAVLNFGSDQQVAEVLPMIEGNKVEGLEQELANAMKKRFGKNRT